MLIFNLFYLSANFMFALLTLSAARCEKSQSKRDTTMYAPVIYAPNFMLSLGLRGSIARRL
jgi:hypothetical protein